jgi:hypothetical protein
LLGLLAFIPIAWWIYPQIIGSSLFNLMFTWDEPISEISGSNPIALLLRLNILIAVVVYGVYKTISERSFEPLSLSFLCAVFVLVPLTIKFKRIEFVLTSFIAVLAGYYLYKYFNRDNAGIVLSLFVVFSIVISVFSIGIVVGTAHYNSDWDGALRYLDTLPYGTVLTWWDYGYWVSAATNQTVYTDPSQRNVGDAAHIFLTDPVNATRLINESHINYVAVATDDGGFYRSMVYYYSPTIDYNESYLHAVTETSLFNSTMIYQKGRIRIFTV